MSLRPTLFAGAFNTIKLSLTSVYFRGLSKLHYQNLHVCVTSGFFVGVDVAAKSRCYATLTTRTINQQQEQLQRTQQQQTTQKPKRLFGGIISSSRQYHCLGSGIGSGSVCPLVKLQKLRKVGFSRMHSTEEDVELSQMIIKILPALQDNYMYMLIDKSTRQAAVIDPVDPDYVVRVAEREKVKLTHVLTTHHHWDHAGGNEKLVKLWPEKLEVLGGDERIGALTNNVSHNETFELGGLTGTCIFTPCHTKGHICYYMQSADKKDGIVFTGDTLFSAGCGRFFEGTADQMYKALIERLSDLPNDTKVFPGHEYTLQNLYFARHVEPENENLLQRIEWARLRRCTNDPTIPSTIGEEKTFNPFMRVHQDNIQEFYGLGDAIPTMAAMRKDKDNWKG